MLPEISTRKESRRVTGDQIVMIHSKYMFELDKMFNNPGKAAAELSKNGLAVIMLASVTLCEAYTYLKNT